MSDISTTLRVSLLLLASAWLAACSGPEARTGRYLQRSQDYMADGKLEKARIELRNALQVSPNNAQVRYQNAIIEEKLGEYPRALALYQGAIDVDAKYDLARARLARLYMFANAPERAMEVLKPGLDANPTSVDLLTIRAATRGRLKDPAGAIADAERARSLAPNDEAAIIVLTGLYAANGRADEARTLLEVAAAKNPKSTDLRDVLAQFYATHEELPKAEAALAELVQLEPKQAARRVALARFYVATGRVEEGERTMREAIKAIPEDTSLRTSLVQLLAERRSRAAAVQELQGMIAERPKDYELQFTLGRYLEQDKQFDQAEAAYRRIIAAEGKKGPALVARDRIAAIYVQQGSHEDEMHKLVAEVLEANPRDNDALMIRSSVALAARDAKSAIVDLRAIVRDHPEQLAVQRQLARAYFMNGDGQLGEDLLRQVMNGNPNDDTARFDLAQYYLQSGRPQQAKALTDQLVQREPKNLAFQQAAFQAAMGAQDARAAAAAVASLQAEHPEQPAGPLAAGMLAEVLNHPDEALKDYQRALELQPAGQQSLSATVRLLLRQKKYDAAVAIADKAAAVTPQDAFPLNLKGEVLAAQQHWPEALAAFESASALQPKWWLPYRNQALVRVSQKDPDAAIKVLKEGSAKADQPEVLASDLTALLQRQGRRDEAIGIYEQLLAKHPDSELAANNLAMLLAARSTDAASLTRAATLAGRFSQSRNPDYLDTYGWVLLRQGKANAALPPLEKAVGLAPDSGLLRYHLALTQFAAGQKQAARDNLERAVQGKQEFDGIADARSKLAEWKQAG